jgi:hypothetical protein
MLLAYALSLCAMLRTQLLTASRASSQMPRRSGCPECIRRLSRVPQQRDWRRPSSVRFWRLDLSCGAGSISTPVLAEHQKNASEIAVLGEGAFSMLCSCLPKYILLSGLAIITRELTSRETTAVVLRSLESTEAKPRAEALSKSLRSSLDTRISRVLAGGGFGDTRGLWERVVAMEMAEVGLSVSNDGTVLSNITSFEDLVNNPVARTLVRLRPPRPGCLSLSPHSPQSQRAWGLP